MAKALAVELIFRPAPDFAPLPNAARWALVPAMPPAVNLNEPEYHGGYFYMNYRRITTCLAIFCVASCIYAAVRPGKGMELVPGDVAEYSTIKFSSDGKVSAKQSSIMVAIGSQGEFEQVGILTVVDEKVVSSQTVLYDLSKKRVEEGELIESGTEAVSLHGKSYKCSWQKRRTKSATATFWRCPDLPFEHLAKMVLETPDGQKQTTELVYFGPPAEETEESRNFQDRLKKLMSQ